ncbi:hypothetical protein [Alteromonas gracilis]|uniref:hypothetical protein n=1 Tax=Alteromonas gracilis TaxID=1479524 RepID=UPI0037358D32
MKRILVNSCCLIFALLTFCVQPQEQPLKKKSITLGVVEFPPLVIKGSDNVKCYGEAVDASIAILSQLQFNVNVECMPPARLFERVKTGKVDLTINVQGTSALDQNATFLKTPFVNLSIVLLRNKMVGDDKSISAIRGYDYLGIRQTLQTQGFTFFDMATSTDAIHLFDIGRTSHLISYKQPYLHYINKQRGALPNIEMSEQLSVQSYFAISNTGKYKDDLVRQLEKATDNVDNSTILEFFRSTNQHNLSGAFRAD